MALPADNVYLSGKAKWVRTISANEWGDYTCTLYPDADSIVKINKLKEEGIKNVLQKDEDGYYMRFKCPTKRVLRGQDVYFTVKVIDKDGTEINDKLIGNGSDVTIKLDVYAHRTPGGGKAKAARLVGIMVNTLVPYVSDAEEELAKKPEPVKPKVPF